MVVPNRSRDTVDTKELLGALLQRGMTDSGQRRIDNSLGDDGLAGILEKEFGATPTRAPAQTKVPVGEPAPQGSPSRRTFDGPKDRGAPEVSAERRSGGGLSSMFGKSFKGALGAGALALLGSIAIKVLQGSSQQKAGSPAKLVDGLLEPENVSEKQQSIPLADLIVKAMVNAAKADGRIDEDEFQKVVGELQGQGITQAERDFLLSEVRKPMCTSEIVQAVTSREVGAQVYAASLLAIEVDTPAEKAYLQKLASDIGLESQVVKQIHATLGVA